MLCVIHELLFHNTGTAVSVKLLMLAWQSIFDMNSLQNLRSNHQLQPPVAVHIFPLVSYTLPDSCVCKCMRMLIS